MAAVLTWFQKFHEKTSAGIEPTSLLNRDRVNGHDSTQSGRMDVRSYDRWDGDMACHHTWQCCHRAGVRTWRNSTSNGVHATRHDFALSCTLLQILEIGERHVFFIRCTLEIISANVANGNALCPHFRERAHDACRHACAQLCMCLHAPSTCLAHALVHVAHVGHYARTNPTTIRFSKISTRSLDFRDLPCPQKVLDVLDV